MVKRDFARFEFKMRFGRLSSETVHLAHTEESLFNAYELLNLRALTSYLLNELNIFQCMGNKFQSTPLKLHTKYPTHTLKITIIIQDWNLKSS